MSCGARGAGRRHARIELSPGRLTSSSVAVRSTCRRLFGAPKRLTFCDELMVASMRQRCLLRVDRC